MIDPHLHADAAEGGLGLGGAEVDLGPQRVKRHPTFAVPLLASHLGTAQAPGCGDPNAQRPRAHGGLNRPAHGASESYAAGELLGDVLSKERGVGLGPDLAGGLVHVLDLHVDALLGEALDVLAQAIHLSALAPDHDAGARRADEYPHLVALALDVDGRDTGPRQPRTDVTPDPDVLVKVLRVVAVGVPIGLPGVDDPQPEPVRVDLVSH